jgi:hypothetical protein
MHAFNNMLKYFIFFMLKKPPTIYIYPIQQTHAQQPNPKYGLYKKIPMDKPKNQTQHTVKNCKTTFPNQKKPSCIALITCTYLKKLQRDP